MYILYLDESGQHGGEYFVLAGLAVFERQTHWLATELDKLQYHYLPEINTPIEFHATDIRAGKKPPWDQLKQEERYSLINSVYNIVGSLNDDNLALFSVVISRDWFSRRHSQNEDEYGFAFESIIKLFDNYLAFRYKSFNDTQRGLVVIAASQYQRRLETLGKQIKLSGTRWGITYNMADIPLFTLSENSRMLQLADFCANTIWGRYEKGLAKYFDKISHKFFHKNNTNNFCGIYHYSFSHSICTCPACIFWRDKER